MTLSSGDDRRERYRPVDALDFPRFEGIRTFMRLSHLRELHEVDVAIVGVPFDTATSFRPGARFGPEAIRAMSMLLRPYHGVHEVDVFDELAVVDYGDLPIVPGNTERTITQIEQGLRPLVDAGVVPIVLGGDHSITLGTLRALARAHGPLALVLLDAHSDTGDSFFGERYYHGTTFRRAIEEGLLDARASVQAGLRGSLYDRKQLLAARELGLHVITADELRDLGARRFADVVREHVEGRPVFLSFDIDFADPAFAPATGTPEIGGFSSAEATAILRNLVDLELAGFDCVEVAPAYDSPGQPTSLLAANVVWEVLGLLARAARAKER